MARREWAYALALPGSMVPLGAIAQDEGAQEVMVTAMRRDAKAMVARLGTGYGVGIEGLNAPVEWARSGSSEVMLYKLTVVPVR